MTSPNTAQPGATAVPSAQAERRRIWDDDRFGLAIYAGAVAAFAVIVIVLVTNAS